MAEDTWRWAARPLHGRVPGDEVDGYRLSSISPDPLVLTDAGVGRLAVGVPVHFVLS